MANVRTGPSMYHALIDELSEHNLSWDDIEAVAIAKDYRFSSPGGYTGTTKIVDGNKARQILEKTGLRDLGDPPRDNIPFYAFTKDRIFYLGFNDEVASYWIDSIPRNPTYKELPRQH